MIKLTYCLHRKKGMSREEFQEYWLKTHGPLVASFADTLRIKRYVQTHTHGLEADDALRASRVGSLEDAPEIYDGVAELWFESYEDLAAGSEDPAAAEAGQALLEDERKFIDLTRSPLWFSEEHVIV